MSTFVLFAVAMMVAFVLGAMLGRGKRPAWNDFGSEEYGRQIGKLWLLDEGLSLDEALGRLDQMMLNVSDPFCRGILRVFEYDVYQRQCADMYRLKLALQEHYAVLCYYKGHVGN